MKNLIIGIVLALVATTASAQNVFAPHPRHSFSPFPMEADVPVLTAETLPESLWRAQVGGTAGTLCANGEVWGDFSPDSVHDLMQFAAFMTARNTGRPLARLQFFASGQAFDETIGQYRDKCWAMIVSP